MSSGVARDQTVLLGSLPAIARDGEGRPLASAELVVMVDLPRRGQTELRLQATLALQLQMTEGFAASPVMATGWRPAAPILSSEDTASLRMTWGRLSRMRRKCPA